jgi:hypothetical protein
LLELKFAWDVAPRLKWLKVLDGRPVTSREMGESHRIFEGKLTYDSLQEKVRPNTYEDIQVSPPSRRLV